MFSMRQAPRELEAMWLAWVDSEEEFSWTPRNLQVEFTTLPSMSILDRAELDPVIAAEVNRGDWD